jgi:periplasmic protein TonB
VLEYDIAPSEIDLDDILKPSEIVDARIEEEPEKVPFEFIEKVQVFPGCENLLDNAQRKSCMSSRISKFVGKEFDSGLGEELGFTGMNLVLVMFVVNREGEVEQIQTRAPHAELENEARRVNQNYLK